MLTVYKAPLEVLLFIKGKLEFKRFRPLAYRDLAATWQSPVKSRSISQGSAALLCLPPVPSPFFFSLSTSFGLSTQPLRIYKLSPLRKNASVHTCQALYVLDTDPPKLCGYPGGRGDLALSPGYG